MEQLLALEMIRVTEAAAIASARFMGRGARDEADQAATEAMRKAMDETNLAGTIVIGEGERDDAPMCLPGIVGMARGSGGRGRAQWRKWRRPVNTIARWWRSATSIAISSRIDPPGWMIAVIPALAAIWIPSGNGK